MAKAKQKATDAEEGAAEVPAQAEKGIAMTVILISSADAWLLAASGLVIVAAGVWGVSRARRHENDQKKKRRR